MEVGADHPVVKELNNHWQKIASLIMWKLKAPRVEIMMDDIHELIKMNNDGHLPTIVAHSKKDRLVILLMSHPEAEAYSKLHEEGEV